MSVFYVYQGDTYKPEREGNYIWAPQLNRSGGKNAGYTMMTKVQKGDFILHNENGKINSISIAQTDCYESDKPDDLIGNIEWNNEGYRIDTAYQDLEVPLVVTQHKEWLADHYVTGSAFTKNGTGKQQYMCSLADNHAVYLIEKAIELQSDPNTIKILMDALDDIVGDKESEYDPVEKDTIDQLVDEASGPIPMWRGVMLPQEMTMASSSQRETPKRNKQNAADALYRAGFKCEYDNNDRIFLRKSGKGYTEPHHLIPISKYRDFDYKKCSLDAMENIVSLCSHCHNLLHYGRMKDKLPVLEKLYEDRKDALSKVGLEITLEQLLNYYR